ncbi:ADYC domain-containing protein [Sorangium sp. So ce1099]|uniref:ADYC domain-containing protein n=1 Tax=Sorangium sp. So ce1099 TaxID=3133331 RepID=UPI003F6429C0
MISGAACAAADVDVEETLAGESEIVAKESEPISLSAAPEPSLQLCTRPLDSGTAHRSRNGVGLHGRWDPGLHYGDFEPSEVPRRFQLAGITRGGQPIDDVRVHGRRLHGRFRNGPLLGDADWVGAVLNVYLLCTDSEEAETRFQARIDRVSPSGYELKIRDAARSSDLGEAAWRPACAASLEDPEAIWAVPFAEVWDKDGTRSSSSASFTFACPTSAIIKCDAMGYGDGAQTSPLRQTCTRMVRADYSGNNDPATIDGVLIDVEDNQGIQVRELEGDDPVPDLEAVWGPTGAICRNYPRIPGDRDPLPGLSKCSPADAAPDPSRPDLIRSWSCGPGSMCRQYSSAFVKNWPASGSGGLTQWSDVIVVNPNPTAATVKLSVIPTGGGAPLPGALTVTIAGFGTYRSYGDARWRAIDGKPTDENRPSSGWIALASNKPVVATHRTVLRTEGTWNAPARLIEDEPFLTSPQRRLFSSFYLKNWPEAGGKTQWSNVVVNNPAKSPVSIQVRIHGVDGSLHAFNRTLAARGVWNSYGDSDWLAVPNNNLARTAALGWVEIRATEPVVATNRVVHRSGSTYNAPVALLDDLAFSGASAAAKRLAVSEFRRNIPATGTKTEWSSLVVNNPHPEAVTITVTVHRNDGSGDLGSFTKVIPGSGAWNAYGDPDWTSIPATASGGRSTGWVEISASRPVFGTNRMVLRDGGALSSPVAQFNDDLLATPSSRGLVSGLYIKNWPGGEGLTQWSAPVINNPSAEPVMLRVQLRMPDGAPLDELTREIRAKGSWDAANDPGVPGDPGWFQRAESDGANHRSLGTIAISAPRPLIATNRITLRQGTTADAPIVLYEAAPFVGTAFALPDN